MVRFRSWSAPVQMQSSYSAAQRGKRIHCDIAINIIVINIVNNKITIIVVIIVTCRGFAHDL
jgi:hypothetical protein